MLLWENISLSQYTSFKIGGPARYFLIAKNGEDLIKAVRFAKDKNIFYFVLGEGTNLLVSDKGYAGAVIQICLNSFRLKGNIISAAAGVKISDLIIFSIRNGLTGLEWAAGIPGTVGGAVRGNAGAFDGCIADSIKKVRVLNNDLEFVDFDFSKCEFDYRNSLFKEKENKNIIVSADFELKSCETEKSAAIAEGYLKHRKEKHPLEYPSAGCVFKNTEKGPAAKLIEECNLKGKRIGGAEISKKHANFIVNIENAKAKDVIDLINLAKKEVKKKFGVVLKEEIQYLGF